jgi:hypothetical protein
MRQSKSGDKRSRRPPKSVDEGFRNTGISQHRDVPNRITKSPTDKICKSTEPRWQSTTDLSLSRRRSNELTKGGHSCVYTIKSYQQVDSPWGGSVLRHAPRSRPRCQLGSRLAKSNKLTKILLKPPNKSATMKSTGWSPKRTSKDDYLVK